MFSGYSHFAITFQNQLMGTRIPDRVALHILYRYVFANTVQAILTMHVLYLYSYAQSVPCNKSFQVYYGINISTKNDMVQVHT
jgi:hypothetical protein